MRINLYSDYISSTESLRFIISLLLTKIFIVELIITNTMRSIHRTLNPTIYHFVGGSWLIKTIWTERYKFMNTKRKCDKKYTKYFQFLFYMKCSLQMTVWFYMREVPWPLVCLFSSRLLIKFRILIKIYIYLSKRVWREEDTLAYTTKTKLEDHVHSISIYLGHHKMISSCTPTLIALFGRTMLLVTTTSSSTVTASPA